MQEILKRWLTRRPQCPGVVAWGLCFSDRSTTSQGFTTQITPEAMEALWIELAEALLQTPRHDVKTQAMRWVFDTHVLYAAVRPDGVCMGVMVGRTAEETSRECIERTLADFRAVRVAGTTR